MGKLFCSFTYLAFYRGGGGVDGYLFHAVLYSQGCYCLGTDRFGANWEFLYLLLFDLHYSNSTIDLVEEIGEEIFNY